MYIIGVVVKTSVYNILPDVMKRSQEAVFMFGRYLYIKQPEWMIRLDEHAANIGIFILQM